MLFSCFILFAILSSAIRHSLFFNCSLYYLFQKLHMPQQAGFSIELKTTVKYSLLSLHQCSFFKGLLNDVIETELTNGASLWACPRPFLQLRVWFSEPRPYFSSVSFLCHTLSLPWESLLSKSACQELLAFS